MMGKVATVIGLLIVALLGVANACEVTFVSDKGSYFLGQGTQFTATVANNSQPVKAVKIYLDSDGGSLTGYTDFTGRWTGRIGFGAGSHSATLTVPVCGDQKYSVDFSVSELKIIGNFYPDYIQKGNLTVLKGRVFENGVPVKSEIVVQHGSEQYLTSTNGFGEFELKVNGTKVGFQSYEVSAFRQGLTGDAAFLVNVNGTRESNFTIVAPGIVKPNANFTIKGTWTIDGEPVNDDFSLTFDEQIYRVNSEDGIWTEVVTAPAVGCKDIVALTTVKEVCVSDHSEVFARIEVEPQTIGENTVRIKAFYEDGTPVLGSVILGIGSEQRPEFMDGTLEFQRNFSYGTHYLSARVFAESGLKTFKQYSFTIAQPVEEIQVVVENVTEAVNETVPFVVEVVEPEPVKILLDGYLMTDSNVSINYAVTGSGNITVTESITGKQTQRELTLPAKIVANYTLPAGENEFCVAAGNVTECKNIYVSKQSWQTIPIIFVIVVVAALLLFF